MTRISRNKLSDEILYKLFDLFFEIVGKKNNKDEFNKVIYDLLSPVERIMIAKRIAIMYLLLKNIHYKKICSTLKVSSSTVAKFQLLMEKSNGVVPTFNRILQNEQFKLFFEDLYSTLFAPGVPGINWKSAWELKQSLDRKKTTGI